MSMNYYQHLVKLNELRNGGDRGTLRTLLVRYWLRRIFELPMLVRLFRARKYRRGRKLFYTVLTGNYDLLNEISFKEPGWDYVCYTDNPDLEHDGWDIRLLENSLNLDPIRLSRYYKINNHLVDGGYDYSIYVDANLRIRGSLDAFLAQTVTEHTSIAMLLHPFLYSLKQELEQCIAAGKDDENLLRQQYDFYQETPGFTDQYPHINARMILRRPGDTDVRLLMEAWFAELLRWSRRDQMAFNYCLYTRGGVTIAYVPYWIFRPYFKNMDHC